MSTRRCFSLLLGGDTILEYKTLLRRPLAEPVGLGVGRETLIVDIDPARVAKVRKALPVVEIETATTMR